MTFNDLHKDIDCDCLENALEDFESEFGLKTNKNRIRPVDFQSHWEKNMRPKVNSCEAKCSYKGKSLSKLKDGTALKEVMKIYQDLFPISPGYKPFLTIVKFADHTGKVKHTPSNRNQHHHDFFKCDKFTFENIKQINSIPLG